MTARAPCLEQHHLCGHTLGTTLATRVRQANNRTDMTVLSLQVSPLIGPMKAKTRPRRSVRGVAEMEIVEETRETLSRTRGTAEEIREIAVETNGNPAGKGKLTGKQGAAGQGLGREINMRAVPPRSIATKRNGDTRKAGAVETGKRRKIKNTVKDTNPPVRRAADEENDLLNRSLLGVLQIEEKGLVNTGRLGGLRNQAYMREFKLGSNFLPYNFN